MAEGGANSPVATATTISIQKGEESTVKPKRTRGKSTGVKAKGRTSILLSDIEAKHI